MTAINRILTEKFGGNLDSVHELGELIDALPDEFFVELAHGKLEALPAAVEDRWVRVLYSLAVEALHRTGIFVRKPHELRAGLAKAVEVIEREEDLALLGACLAKKPNDLWS